MALTDSAGSMQTQYSYGPFGNTSTSGVSSSSGSQYTGRENDGTGLYYYRARYYSPSLQRFISEDPIGFSGGDINLYAYAFNSPTNFTDPSGLTCEEELARRFLNGISFGNPLSGPLFDAISMLMDAVNGRKISSSKAKKFKDEVVWTAIGAAIGAGIGGVAAKALGRGVGRRVFRAIGQRELHDVLRFGDYGLSPSGGGKYFALTEGGAVSYANHSFNSGRRMTVTDIEIPKSFLDRGHTFNDPGGAGPSIHFADDVLMDLYKVMGLPRILRAPWVPTIGR